MFPRFRSVRDRRHSFMSLAHIYLDGATVYVVVDFGDVDVAVNAFIAMTNQVEEERKLELTIQFHANEHKAD